MVTFNRLNSDPNLTGSDQFPVYDAGSNRLRKTTMTAISQFVQDALGVSGGLVGEAPVDDKTYGRRNKEWFELDTSGAGSTIPLLQPRQTGDGVRVEFETPVAYSADARGFFINIDGIEQRPVTDYNINEQGKCVFTDAPPKDSLIDIRYFQPSTQQSDISTSNILATGTDTQRTAGDRAVETVNVLDFGADPTGVEDATNQIQKAATFAKDRGLKLIANRGTFLISGTSLDLRGVALDFKAILDFKDDLTGYVNLGGNASTTFNPKQYLWAVRADDSRNASTPLCQIKGAKNQWIEVEHCDSLWLYANNADIRDNYSIAYSTFTFNQVNRISLIGEAKGSSSQAGWINENTFYLNRCHELWINTTDVDTYSHNNNRFYGGTFEGSTAHIEVVKGSDNTWYDLRLESFPSDGLVFRENGIDNRLFVTWTSSDSALPSFAQQYINEGYGNIVGHVDDALFQNQTVMDITPFNVQFDDDAAPKRCNLLGIGQWSSREEDATPTGTITVTKPNPTTLRSKSWSVIARTNYVPVSQCRNTWLTVDSGGWESGAGYRLAIWGYDENGDLLTAGSEDVIVVGRGPQPFGGGINSGNRFADRIKINRSDCHFISVAVICGNVSSEFKYIKVVARVPKSRFDISGATKTRTGASMATIGIPPALGSSSTYEYTPLLTSHAASAHTMQKQVFDVTGQFGEDITRAFNANLTPVLGTSSAPNGLIFDAMITADNQITVRISNITNSNIPMPSGMRPRILLTKI